MFFRKKPPYPQALWCSFNKPQGACDVLSTQRNVTPSYIYHCLIDFKDGGDRTEFIYHQSKYVGPIYKQGAPFTPWYQLQAMGETLRAS